jgi:hypothetical protein
MIDNWIKNEANMISPSDSIEVVEILESCFDLSGHWGKIGYLIGEIIMEGSGHELTEIPGRPGKIFLPGIKQLDSFDREVCKIDSERFRISQALQLIEKGETETIEISLKLNKGKSKSAKTITIQQPENLSLILNFLKTLPEGSEPKQSIKGRNENKHFKVFINKYMQACFKLAKIISPEITEKDKLFFTGLILTLAGIFEPPRFFNNGYKIETEQIPDYKLALTDRLKYYKSAH